MQRLTGSTLVFMNIESRMCVCCGPIELLVWAEKPQIKLNMVCMSINQRLVTSRDEMNMNSPDSPLNLSAY